MQRQSLGQFARVRPLARFAFRARSYYSAVLSWIHTAFGWDDCNPWKALEHSLPVNSLWLNVCEPAVVEYTHTHMYILCSSRPSPHPSLLLTHVFTLPSSPLYSCKPHLYYPQAVSAFINQCESSFAKTVNDYVKRVLSKLAEQSDDDE